MLHIRMYFRYTKTQVYIKTVQDIHISLGRKGVCVCVGGGGGGGGGGGDKQTKQQKA